MADDLNRKLQTQLEQLRKDVDRLQRTNPLEAASVTSGRVRFIGGLLRVDGGGSVEIVGTLAIDGTTTVTGTFKVTGPWRLEGNGVITGNVSITGDVTSTGTLTQNGPWNLNGVGKITGNTGLTGNLTVSGSGKITVGSVVIEPTGEFGGRIRAGSTLQLDAPLTHTSGSLTVPGLLTASGGVWALLPIGSGTPKWWVGSSDLGILSRYPSGSGGPMGGDFEWPFSLSIVSSEFGMRVHPITGVWTMHYGIDFGAPSGANIPAASSGTVLSTGFDSGRGNYVVLSHPNNVETHYFHMVSTPPVSVGQAIDKGQTIGQVGNTGGSDGAHLHFEVHVNGTAINPRDFAPLD